MSNSHSPNSPRSSNGTSTTQDIIDAWDINPRDWVSESAEVREQIYANIPAPRPPKGKRKLHKGERPLPDLGYEYVYKFQPVVERQLQRGGVRLAAYLNALFAEPRTMPAK